VNLWGVDLEGAYLEGAYLEGANLWGVDLRGVNLEGAIAIRAAGPVGDEDRIIYGVDFPGGVVMVQAGCFWETSQEMIEAVKAKYPEGPGRDRYLAAVASISTAP
jgi:hypothetical protein